MQGSGTLQDPYLITTPQEWLTINSDSAAHYALGNDLDFDMGDYDGVTGLPGRCQTTPFSGSLDGRGFSIRNVKLYATHEMGLFCRMSGKSRIHDLKLKNVIGVVPTQAWGYKGFVVGDARPLEPLDDGKPNYENIVIEDSSLVYTGSNPNVSSNGYYGGVAGQLNQYTVQASGSKVYRCRLRGCEVIGPLSNSGSGVIYAGGIVGYFGASSAQELFTRITECSVEDSEVRAYSCCGGISGYAYQRGRIQKCFVKDCTLQATTDPGVNARGVGGITGVLWSPAEILDCFVLNTHIDIPGRNGGIVGQAVNSPPGLVRCYSRVTIAPDPTRPSLSLQPLVGSLGSNMGQLYHVYWDTDYSGLLTTWTNGGVGKTTAQMMDDNTYEGFDFEEVWGHRGSVNYGFPYLQWALTIDAEIQYPNNVGIMPEEDNTFKFKITPEGMISSVAYEWEWRVLGAAEWQTTGKIFSTQTSYTFPPGTFAGGNYYECRVRFWEDGQGDPSVWSGSALFNTFKPVIHNPTPMPDIRTKVQIMNFGALLKSPYGRDIQLTIQISTNPGFTDPTTYTLAAVSSGEMAIIEHALQEGGTWYVRLTATDTESLQTVLEYSFFAGEYKQFIKLPSIHQEPQQATHVTVRVRDSATEYTAIVDPAPPADRKVEWLFYIQSGTQATCQAVAEAYLAKLGRPQVKVSGKIPLAVTLWLRRKIRVVVPIAGIDEEMILRKKMHRINKGDKATYVELGDIMVSDNELTTRILERVKIN